MPEERIEKEFSVSKSARVRLSNIRGSVDVQAGDEGVVHVVAVKHVDTGDAERTRIEMSQEEDGTVRIKTNFEKAGFLSLGRPCRVDYSLRVPPSCWARVRCVSCGASVRGLSGELDLKTVSGAVTLEELSGRVGARSVSGKITGEQLSGPARLGTVSGNVHLSASTLPSLQASSVSGDFVLETTLEGGPYEFKTVSGDVELIVPSECSCTVETRTVSGRLRASLPATRTWGKPRRRGADLQGGGPSVQFRSTSGDLRVVCAEGEAAVEPDLEPAPPSSRSEILERIASGEITPEQGLKEIKKMGKRGSRRS
jgi:hypothetical protein